MSLNLLETLRKKQAEKLFKEGYAANPSEPESLSGGDVLKSAFVNLPGSAAQLVSDVTMPIRHPIQTAQSLASLGRGIYQLTTEGEQPDEATAKAVGQFFADRYGSFEGFKRAFATDPLGIVSDISVVFTGGAGLAAKVPGVAGKTTATISKVGNIIDPVQATGKAISATTKGIGNAAAPLFGMTSGSGGDALKVAFEAGEAGGDAQKLFIDNLRGNVTPDEIVPKALQAVKDLGDTRKGDYKTNKAALKLENSPVDFKTIKQKIFDFENSNKFEGMSELSAKAQIKLKDIKKIVDEFEKNPKLHNARGMDTLKRRIDAEYPTGLQVGDAGMVVTDIRNSIKAQIIKEVPEYGKVMNAYESAIKLEKQFMQELSLSNNKAAGTILRKLQSSMRNNVNTSYGSRLDMLKSLDPNLVTEIAGQALNTYTPRGLQGISAGSMTAYGVPAAAAGMIHPAALIGLPLQSPRLIGETALKIGQLSRKLKPLQSPAALTAARGSRVVGEIEGATEIDAKQELLNLLLKKPSSDNSQTPTKKGFDDAQLSEIKSDALTLQDEFEFNVEDDDDVNSNIIYAATGGDISQGINMVPSDVLQEYKNIFSPDQIDGGPLQKEIVSLQRLIKQTQNSKSADQTLKNIQGYQERLDTSIQKTNSDSPIKLALMKMKEVLDGSVYNKIETGLISGDKEVLDQLQDATGLYKNYMGLMSGEGVVENRERAANKILGQITNKNYTPRNTVNLLFGHNKLAPNQSLPLVMSKLRNALPEEQFVEVKALLKDGILTKAFSDDDNEASRSGIVKNYNDIFKNQKEIINALFTPNQLLKVKEFKENVLPTLWAEIKLNPDKANYTIASALAKKELLTYPEPQAEDSSINAVRQTLNRFQAPLVLQSLEETREPEFTDEMPSNDVNLRSENNLSNLQGSIDNFQMPQVQGSMFDAPPPSMAPPPTLAPQQMVSPTLLPNEDDREIAMRQQAGIAGLV